MSLHADLLDLAEQLARLDPRRPKQASLRRAVSTAYYALFDLLTWEASSLYALEPRPASRINRTLDHADMKRASSMIANNKLPRGVLAPSGSYTTPPDLTTVASTFVTLQQARHEADYDLSRYVRRRDALDLIRSVRNAFEAWERIRRTDDARIYLACFHLWKPWDDLRR